MPYCDDFWHIDAHDNIPSPACLTVFVKSKTENQLIRFAIAYLRRDFGRSNNSNTFMFANNRDFGKLFKVKQKSVSVLFHEQLKQFR